MTKKTNTKRALLMSALALLLCLSMLVGSTFAWFTDSVVSGNNIIKSGNLDMKVSYKPYGAENTTWTEIKEDTVVFGKDALYEPGYTEAVWIKVENIGSLAFRYNLALNVLNEKLGKTADGSYIKLSDYLEVKYMVTTSTDMESDFYTTRESLDSFAFGAAANSGVTSLADNITLIKNGPAYSPSDAAYKDFSSSYVLIVINMPTTVGNEANHDGKNIPEINFGLTAVATQLPHESDSFGTDYDAKAEYPIVYDYKVSDFAGLEKAIKEGGNVLLTNDIALDKTLMPTKDTFIDLNGNTISAPSSGTMFQSQSNAKPSMTITSSKDGAEINVTGGDTSVLLGYGSTVIENVTINVTGCDNYSPSPFNVYGDLTIGEGTVVNIDYLGSALINNNGKVAISIDGAEFNIGTFKRNDVMINLNNATTFEMKNTTMKINNYVLSQFGGEGLVKIIDGVKIENCTFDVTDSNGASCTFVPDAGLGRYDLVQK